MNRKALLAVLVLLALSGLMLHYRIHSFMVPDVTQPVASQVDRTKLLFFIFPLIDVMVVTLLFTSRKTVVYGYLLNGLIVIYGTVFMGHYSIAEIYAKSLPSSVWLLKSTLPDIGIAWADFFAGKALYDHTMKGG